MSAVFSGPLFRLSEKRTIPPVTEPAPGEVARGEWWAVRQENGQSIFRYASGEHYGELKQLVISSEEVARLIDGSLDGRALLLAHGV